MKAVSYDACLADIRMPGVGGIEFYRYLENEHPTLAEKVVFTSGDVLGGDTHKFIREVKRPFLAKPFTPSELKKAMHKTLPHTPSST